MSRPLTPEAKSLLGDLAGALELRPATVTAIRATLERVEDAAAARERERWEQAIARLVDPGYGGYIRIELADGGGYVVNCQGGEAGPWHHGDTADAAIIAALKAEP